MIQYRPFRNNDPPSIAEIWRHHAPLRGLVQPMTTELLERFVFAKPYFDRHGLIVACDDTRPVGFLHAGFAASDERDTLSTEVGVVCLAMAAPHDNRREILYGLLEQGEAYLRQRGDRIVFGGGKDPANPFYHGLYGGCQTPGVLATDEESVELFRVHEYNEIEEIKILQRRLNGFRVPMNRQFMQIRRSYQIEPVLDPPVSTWWDACTLGMADRTQFSLVSRSGRQTCGTVVFWDMEPLASSWGVHAAGLLSLEIDEPLRRQGLGTWLLAESLRQLQSQGIMLVETHVDQSNAMTSGLLAKLDFEEVERGIVFQRTL